MLSVLHIKNLGLVDELSVEFGPGYNVVTGETGAGKSLVLGGLKLLMGERADRSLIRSGSDQCLVEGVFELAANHPAWTFLAENGLESEGASEGGTLIFRRSFTASGSNRQFINQSPVQLQTLSKIGKLLVDMHGPHDQQSLLDLVEQLRILDKFSHLEAEVKKFSSVLEELEGVEKEIRSFSSGDQDYFQQLDLLRFQVHEIESARLKGGEEEELKSELQRLSNATRLQELVQSGLGLTGDNEPSLIDQLGSLGRILQELRKLDPGPRPTELVESQAILMDQLRDLHSTLSSYGETLESNPERLAEVEGRVSLLQSLKRKYGSTVEQVIAFGKSSREKLAKLESRDVELAALETKKGQLEKELLVLGRELSSRRKKALPKISEAVVDQLKDLEFSKARFEIGVTSSSSRAEANRRGFDKVEFLFAPNAGEPLKPLRAIASSGEMARVMLALKTVLAQHDEVPVLVFDEVDANIGGVTGRAVGEKMRQIGKNHQVICVSHLASVAAAAEQQFQVTKQEKEGRTISRIQLLDGQGRVEEIARMLGGTSAASLQHAHELLGAHEIGGAKPPKKMRSAAK
jgi:DNA repair protein RecN (Recombination protein N)